MRRTFTALLTGSDDGLCKNPGAMKPTAAVSFVVPTFLCCEAAVGAGTSNVLMFTGDLGCKDVRFCNSESAHFTL